MTSINFLLVLVSAFLLGHQVAFAAKTTPAPDLAQKCAIRVATDYSHSNIIPERYDVVLRTEFQTAGFLGRLVGRQDKNKFKGNVTMMFTAKAASKEMTLHSVNLEIQTADYRQLPKGDWKPMTVTKNESTQSATFKLESGIAAGAGEFRCTFKGKMHQGLAEPGIQLMNITDIKGEHTPGFFSQMVPEGARRVFPCVDFPLYKAIFTLSIQVPTNMTVFGNTPIQAETTVDKTNKLVRFTPTPPMSTFEVAFAAGKFHFIERDVAGLKMRFHVNHHLKPHFGNLVKTMDAFTKAIPALQEFTGHSMGGKLDVLGIDESLRAVSTVGFMAIPQDAMLGIPRNHTQQDPDVADPDVRMKGHVMNALAKQIFGADITMEYWDHIWLSEGIATFLAEKLNGKLYPPQDNWIRYDRSHVRRLNTLETANDSPVKFIFSEPDTVVNSGLVKLATSSKASVFLWMLNRQLGDAAFVKGLKAFVTKHKGSIVKSDDFVNAMQDGSGQEIEWFRNVLNFRGMITLHVECDQVGNNRILQLRQIYYRAGTLPCPRNDSVWSMPVVMDTEEGKSYRAFIKQHLTNVTVPNVAWKSKWAKLSQLHSYYRVLYSANCYENFGLLKGLEGNQISGHEKRMIREDLVHLENLYRRVVVRPENVNDAKITDNYDFTRIRNLVDQHAFPNNTKQLNGHAG